MEQNATQVEFSSRWHAALWLGCELPKFAGLGMLIVEVLEDPPDTNLVTILLITVSVIVQLIIEPSPRPPGWNGGRAVSMAASNRLGLNGPLISKVQTAILVAGLIGFVAAVTVSFSR
jgi:hypothetical protein